MRSLLVLVAIGGVAAACSGSDAASSATTTDAGSSTSSSSSSSSSSGSSGTTDAGDAAPAAMYPHTIPLELQSASDDPSGATKLTLDLKVGASQTFRAKLDTGSNGIVALPSFVPAASVTIPDPTKRVDYVYGGTVKVSGIVAQAIIVVGDVASPAPVDILFVDTIGCAAGHPSCPAAGANIATYQFPGGFGAVMGVGQRSSATQHFIQSPLLQLGGPTSKFVISIGAQAGDHPRSLILEPDDATVARFTNMVTFQPNGDSSLAGVPSYDDRQTPFCINAYCNTGLLDTGGNEQVGLNGAADYAAIGAPNGANQIPGGTPVTVKINTASTFSFTVGTPPTSGTDLINLDGATNNLGRMTFYRFDVLYDPRGGKLGLAAPL